jgi:hypothetical protein
MKKLLIHATKELAIKLEEKLRHRYDVQLDILDDHDDKNKSNVNVCEIKVKFSLFTNKHISVLKVSSFLA